MFYTKAPNSGTIVPRFDSIAAYNSAISKKQKRLDAMNHQQYLLMLRNDVSGMAALDAPIKAAEKDLDGLKIGLGDIMGANIHGKARNQLTGNENAQQNDERAPQVSKPQFAVGDTAIHVTGLNDEADSLFGYRPEDYEEPEDGGNADFFRGQREGNGEVGETEDKSRIDEKGNVKVSKEEIDTKLKEMFPDSYVKGSIKMTDQEPNTKDVSKFMAGLTNVGRDVILDIPFWGASKALTSGSKLFNVGKHATEAAKIASDYLSKGTNIALGDLGGSILGEILDVPDELPGKKTRYLITANVNGNENTLLNVDIHENGQMVITYFNPQEMGW